jgi:hypothetical protein
MGQQQLLLIILGVIIVGIAIAVGLSLFRANSIQANKDAIINDINNLAANAYQFRIRPVSMAGGSGDYSGGLGYKIPFKMSSNDNATYTCAVTAGSGTTGSVQFTGKSVTASQTSNVIGSVDAGGRVTFSSFTGDFAQ